MSKDINKIDEEILHEITQSDPLSGEAYNIRKDGAGIQRKVNEYINIVSKEDGTGIDIYVKEGTKKQTVYIPVILTVSGLKDVVYNDFYIGKDADVVIVAGCGIHNDEHKDSQHDGIHRFFLEENSKVEYIERHYGEGSGDGKRILNPVTEVDMKKGSYMHMETIQIKGVDDTVRITKAKIDSDATLVVSEKILTNGTQKAKTEFVVELNGENASTQVTSRSVATEDSYQEFKSNVVGNTKSYGHVECDAIIKDHGTVKAIPEIYAKDVDASLVHEAVIGKIAGEQLMKLMSLGLTEKEAENAIIDGFLK